MAHVLVTNLLNDLTLNRLLYKCFSDGCYMYNVSHLDNRHIFLKIESKLSSIDILFDNKVCWINKNRNERKICYL